MKMFFLMRDPYKLYPHDHVLRPIIALMPDSLRPNHLTIARMVLTPLILILLVFEMYEYGVPLFILTACTDALDGSLARWRKQITPWGTFYDPVADKLLIGSVILLILLKHVNPYLGFAIIFVELLMVAGGWYHRRRGDKIEANVWGKIKMLLQFFGVMFLLFALWFGVDMFVPLSNGILVLAVLFSITALLTYSL